MNENVSMTKEEIYSKDYIPYSIKYGRMTSLIGVVASSKLTQYRIAQLEEKVSKHNSIVERTYKLEGAVTELQHDVRDLK